MTDTAVVLDQIPKIKHGFGTQATLFPEVLSPYRHTLADKKQVHGTHIVDITQANQQCGNADGFYTEQPGLLLSVLTADCLPLLFSRNDGSAVAAVHAGWRGLLDGIIEKMAQRINRDDDTRHWSVAIGPAAGACCYEVDEALAARFIQTFPLPAHVISPRFRHLDLRAIAQHKLAALGFAQIGLAGSCTICTRAVSPTHPVDHELPFKYTSYRYHYKLRELDPTHPSISGRNQYAGIVIQL